ncbi:hypothetical protein [Nocardia sp. NPDC005366]|uniref:hypothetical protein n=1 Tax=Nocardia sp. NPDC005366 TaxID=3156878 RepID=UPI0033AC3B8B
MEHGQRGAESIGAILSGIAEILREVSDKLDAVAARVEEDRPDDGALATRLAKLEAWAFRTEHDVTKLGTRVEAIESGQSRPAEPAVRADSAPRPQPGSRAERRELAARAEQEAPVRGEQEPAPELPGRGESQLPVRGGHQLPVRGESQPAARVEHELPTRDKSAAPARERLLPRAAASRGDRTEAPANADAAESAPTVARTAQTEVSGDRRIPPVPAALHDWVEPLTPTIAPTEPVSRAEPPIAPPPITTPSAERTDSFTPRYEPVPVEAPVSNGQYGVDYNSHSERLEISSSHNGRLEAPTPALNGHASSAMTASHTEGESNGSHRSVIEDTGHVDKLQAMLDELKRNPHGPFGRPLGSPGEMPA